MIKTIFRNIFLVGLFVLMLCAGLFFAVRYTQTIDEAYEDLLWESDYIISGIENQGTGYLENLETRNRITWIDQEGNVLFDNTFGESIPNQLSCEEVKGALENGSYRVIRRSESASSQAVYYAVKCSDGTVIRLSRPLSAVQNALNFISPVIWILVIVIIISGFLAYRAAKQIVKPINDINPDDPDINEYPELEPLIEKLNEQKLTIQNEAANREQMRREFSANVSHELKTPLTSISGFAELMAQADVPPEKMKEFAGDIFKESQRLITLINDIMKLSQLDEEAFESHFEETDLYTLCRNVIDILKPVADKKGIRIALTGKHIRIRAVPQILSEMIYNLCDNAIKYNKTNGRVHVEVSASGEYSSITVSDTGIGIAREHQDRIFERFYRVDKSHSREIGGTGLGLSIVKHGAMVHNAQVEMESAPAEGTRITLKFPCES